MAELRAFVYLDRLQPQFGSFLGANARGYLPVPGMAAAVVEVAPGIIVSQALDAALKATQVRPGLMVVERHFGLLEFHSPAQAEVKHAAGVVLGSMGFALEDRRRPLVLSSQVIRKVDPYHAQMVNLERAGSLLLPGQDIYILECQPAAYVALAANQAEKSAQVTLVDCNQAGAVGRLILAGRSADVDRAAQAAEMALDGVSGREPEGEGR